VLRAVDAFKLSFWSIPGERRRLSLVPIPGQFVSFQEIEGGFRRNFTDDEVTLEHERIHFIAGYKS
jgi:hypothetical protein